MYLLFCNTTESLRNIQTFLIATAIGEGLIVRTPRMEIVWEPCFIIDKRGLFSFLFRSDVDLADVTGRLTVMCRGPLIFISRQGLYIEVFIIT